MKVGIYHANWGSIGGAESYVGHMAEILGRSYDVEIVHHNSFGLSKAVLEEALRINLDRIGSRLVPIPERIRYSASNPLRHYRLERDWAAELSRPYDLFLLSGLTMPFFCHARRGVLLTHFPLETEDEFHGRDGDEWRKRSRLGRGLRTSYQRWLLTQRFRSYDLKIANSEFTKDWIRRRWKTDSEVVYPPVLVEYGRVKKRPNILAIGRFDPHVKKQDVLVRAFINLCDSGVENWTMTLIGGLNEQSREDGYHDHCVQFVEELKAISSGYPVTFLTNTSGAVLRRSLETSSIFWHAAGFGQAEPGLMEHFGIGTVEAMAAGCVPVVFRGGGQPEIIREGEDGYTWKDPADLLEHSRALIATQGMIEKMSENARKNVSRFSKEAFESRLLTVLADLLY